MSKFINGNNVSGSNNAKNEQEYNEILENTRVNKDSYWDSNNIIIKIIKLGLIVFIVAGVFYYVSLWLS